MYSPLSYSLELHYWHLKSSQKYTLRKITTFLISIYKALRHIFNEEADLEKKSNMNHSLILNAKILDLKWHLVALPLSTEPTTSFHSLAMSTGFAAGFQKTDSTSPISTHTVFSCE